MNIKISPDCRPKPNPNRNPNPKLIRNPNPFPISNPITPMPLTYGFYRTSICESGLGSRNSVRLSTCPSVCLSHAWIVTNLNDALQIF